MTKQTSGHDIKWSSDNIKIDIRSNGEHLQILEHLNVSYELDKLSQTDVRFSLIIFMLMSGNDRNPFYLALYNE